MDVHRMHTKDLDLLTAWAEEFGWVMVDTEPPVLTKAGRTLQLKFNGGGRLTGMNWIGGPEHGTTISGTSSFNKVREWMATEIRTDDDGILP